MKKDIKDAVYLVEEICGYFKHKENKFFLFRNTPIYAATIGLLRDYIENGDLKISQVNSIIENGDGEKSFIVGVPCFECENLRYENFTKSDLIRILKDELDTTCESCKKKLKKLEKIEASKSEEKEELDLQGNTVWYITQYLDPELVWPKEMSIWNKIQALKADRTELDWDYISSQIKSMPYQDFLKTPYWKAITVKKMKEANFKCQICNNKGVLSTHHRSYDIHGMEIFNLKELIVLCQDCHQKHHNKKE